MTASILQSVSHTYWYLTFVCNIIAKICIGYMYNVHGTKNIHIGDWLIFPFSGSVLFIGVHLGASVFQT
jgi:fluoride ion exporter CrcB/FEX